MANNPQNSGAQAIRPPAIGAMGSQNFGPTFSMQFRPLVPVQQGQPFMQSASGTQQFHPLGQGMPPGQSQLPQFSQPLQPMSAWAGRPVHATSSSLASPMPFMQPSITPTSCSPQFQNSATTNNHVPGLGGPGVHLSSSFTFSTSSYGQPQNAMNVASQFQPISQIHTPIAPMGGQHWLPSGTQGAPIVTPAPQTGMHPVTIASKNQKAMSVLNVIQEASSDWQEYTAGDGRRYFYNKRTKKSSWEKPLELMTPLERADASTVWKEFTTAEGKKYYYNKETKQSKWKIPNELKFAREQAEKEASRGSQSGMVTNADPPATVTSSTLEQPLASASSVNDSSLAIPRVASSPVAVKPHTPIDNGPPNQGIDSSSIASGETGTPSPVFPTVNGAPIVLANTSSSPKTNLENSYSHALDGVSVQDSKETKDMSVAGKLNATLLEEKVVDVEPLLYASKQEAKVAFKSLLESANVEADWSWEQAMRVIINDKRYGALKTLGERKQAFNEYLMQKKILEAEERCLRQRKAEDEFMKMLEECKQLTSSMRWSKTIALFEEDKRYKAVEQPADREVLFKTYMVDLNKKERAKAQEEQRQKRLEYKRFLESCGLIKVDTQWRKVKDRLEDDERCSRLEKIDRLEIFQEYIRDLEKVEEEQRKLKKEQIKKVERKNRDEFRKMMEEHVVSGILTANTQWRDYFQKVKESVAYHAVASNTCGATAKDLFEDVTEELEKKYDDDKTRVKDAMKIKKVTVTPAWNFGDFKAAIQDDILSPPLSDINLKLVFEDRLERAKEKEKKEYKRQRHFAKDFTELLYNIKEINASSTWEECLKLFEESSAFRSIGDESFARVTFEEYVARLLEKAKENEYKQEEEKAEKEKEEKKEKIKDKEKDRVREKGKGKERSKNESDSEDVDVRESYGHKEDKRNDIDRERKHHRHKQSTKDSASSDKDEREDSKKSRRHGSGHRKSRKHAYSPKSNSESKHKRHKKDCQVGSGKNGGHEELEDGEFGEDGEIC